MKFQWTPMMKQYMFKLAIRIGIFIAVLVMYLTDKDWLHEVTTQPVMMGIAPMHVLWLVFMIMMIGHIFPAKRLVSMALRKREEDRYVPVEGYDEFELLKFVQDQNVRAWKVMLVWIIPNGFIGLLYLMGVVQDSDLIMLSVFYFLCDYICILFFCPFQTVIMKNKCCVNCRIFDWGHFMMFTPMLFIKNFYSWSLFFTSLVVLIHWELVYAKHPERFWSGSHKTLQCANCKDKTCQIKRKVAAGAKSLAK